MPRLSNIIAVALALAVATLVAAPSPRVLAGGDCTGWLSTVDPPPTIRVGLHDGSVAEVDFHTYVGKVMAVEWSGPKPAAALEAAATAVKQYAWYYALAGHWRPAYTSSTGECFDVKATTADQIYRPGATVSARIWAAVDATWPLTLHKNGRFFLTGYRSGAKAICGDRANGWKLYARSVVACARDGLTRAEIQTIYYSPGVTFHWSTTPVGDVAPVDTPITPPRATLISGAAIDAAYTRIAWDADAARPEGTVYQLQRRIKSGWQSVQLDDPEQGTVDLALPTRVKQRFRVRLADDEGNFGPWRTGSMFITRLTQSRASAFSWHGSWRSQSIDLASGGTTRYATNAGASVSMTFTGRAVGLVGRFGPSSGIARVMVDDELAANVDLGSASTTWRALFFALQWDTSATHTVRVEVVAASGGRSRVDIDAVLYGR